MPQATNLDLFATDYEAARKRFRASASRIDWQLESHSFDSRGPNGEELTLDVACSPNDDPKAVLLVSSGTHGVEGFFGSAVQSKLAESTMHPPICNP